MKRREKVGRSGSDKCVFGRGQKGAVNWWRWGGKFFFFFFLLSHLLCVWCLLPNWNVSCLLPPSHFYIPGTGGWHLATSVAQHAQFPCRSSPKECSGAQREKWTYRLLQRGDESLSPSEAKKISPFFVVFLLITALCNIRKHTGTPKVLLKPASILFSCNMTWGEEKNWSWDYRQQSNK